MENREFALCQQSDIPGIVKNFGAMLSDEDRRTYFTVARDHYSFKGSIVDLGVYMGGTTAALISGALSNQRYLSHQAPATLVHAYDLFRLDWTGVEGANWYWPGKEFREGDSIADIFRANLRPFMGSIQMHEGDIRQARYDDSRDIEILGVDICKWRDLTDSVIKTFFPRLMSGAYVIHQDYIHHWLPHIHVAMGFFSDHFTVEHECSEGDTVLFRMKKPITPDDARRFSERCSGEPSRNWLDYFDIAMEQMKRPETKLRLIPARVLLFAEVEGLPAADAYAREARKIVDETGKQRIEEILAYRRQVHG